jgi:hypothetical protein
MRSSSCGARGVPLRAVGATKITPGEVTTDQAPVYPAVLEELAILLS